MISRITITLGCLALVASAVAEPQTYSSRTTNIRVGTLIVDSNSSGAALGDNPARHLWYSIDQNRQVKPAGWNVYNPRANTVFTGTMRARWNLLGGGTLPATGSRLNKRQASYWEVFLDSMSDASLGNYDVLALPINNSLSLNSVERERLRKYVDQGGVLWIDVQGLSGVGVDPLNGGPIPFEAGLDASRNLDINDLHPLLNTPNVITADDLLYMRSSDAYIGPVNPASLNGLLSTQSSVVPESLEIRPIAGSTTTRLQIGLAQIGDGYVIITGKGISNTISAPYGTNFAANPARIQSPTSDAGTKLVVNMLNINSGFSSFARGSRRTNSTNVDLQAPLLRRYKLPSVPANKTSGSMVVYKGRLVTVEGGRIVVYDANPATDLDFDGDPDDGLTNSSVSGADKIWESQVLSNPSTPTVVEVAGAATQDQILVVDGSGRLQSFALFVTSTNQAGYSNVAPLYSVDPPSASSSGLVPFPPTVHEGLAFIADTNSKNNGEGRVWVVDLLAQDRMKSSRDWSVEGAQRLQPPSSSASVGYIPIYDNSGGSDRVVYVPTAKKASPAVPAGLTSLWVGARGEYPSANDLVVSGNSLIVSTRASLQGLPIYLPVGQHRLGPKISLVEISTGRAFSPALMAGVLDGTISNGGSNGSLRIGITGGGSTPSGAPVVFKTVTGGAIANTSIRIDYTVDWGAAANLVQPESFVRGDLQFGDQITPILDVLGPIAMGPNGNIFAVTSTPEGNNAKPGGSLWALREEGRGEFKLLYRWTLHEEITLPFNNPSSSLPPKKYDPAIIDYDGVIDLIQFGPGNRILNQPIKKTRFAGGPTVRGNTVYVVASGGKQLGPLQGENTSALLAFDADPKTVEFTINLTNPSFSILQPDMDRSSNAAKPEVLSAIQPGLFTFEQVNATGLARVRIESMMSTKRGRIRDALSCNLPLIIRSGGQGDILVEPEATQADDVSVPGNAAGRFNPMRWVTVFNGMSSSAQPVALGDSIYFGGASYLPSFINSGFTKFPPDKAGLLYSIDTVIPSTDLSTPTFKWNWMASSPRPWEKFLNQLTVTPPDWQADNFGRTVVGSPYIKWPQFAGVKTFNDFQVRLNQAVINPDEGTVNGMTGGDGVLVAWGAKGSYAFSRADFLIADQGRILRVDGAGNPIWTAENSYQAGPEDSSSTNRDTQPFSTPTRVYPAGPSTYWVVDSGNNRVARIDGSGRELRTIDRLKIDPLFKPDGYVNNAPLILRGPRDFKTFTTIVKQAENKLSNPRPSELWRHYLIADSGNFRLIELVDRYEYNPTTGSTGKVVEYDDPYSNRPGQRERALGVLLWHGRPELTGKQYAYNSIDRVVLKDTNGKPYPLYIFGFGNVEPNPASFGDDSVGGQLVDDSFSGNGGFVLYDPATNANKVVNKFNLPAIGPDVFWNETLGKFDSPARAAQTGRKFAGLSSVTLNYVGNELRVMVTDRSGVYELIESGAGAWTANWFMAPEAYRVMRRRLDQTPIDDNARGFQPTYARRLDSGEVLIVNGYSGRTRDNSSFDGEVFMLNGLKNTSATEQGFDWNKINLGFNSLSVNFELPPVQGIRGIVLPVFADRR